jgi:hypothetical protein
VARWAWRPVRIGTAFEKTDSDYNARLAERLLASGLGDDLAIALDQVGWKITPRDGGGDPWPMSEPSPLCPTPVAKRGSCDAVAISAHGHQARCGQLRRHEAARFERDLCRPARRHRTTGGENVPHSRSLGGALPGAKHNDD